MSDDEEEEEKGVRGLRRLGGSCTDGMGCVRGGAIKRYTVHDSYHVTLKR